MHTIKTFINEVKIFSKINWWIYIIYFTMLLLIYNYQNERILSVYVITSLHFCADIFIMMMLGAYASKDFKRGAYFQIVSMLIFLSLKIYTGLSGGGWHYLLADPIYLLAAIKNYMIYVKGTDIKIINTKSMFFLSIVIFAVTLLFKRVYYQETILTNEAEWLQTSGIFLFAIALATTKHELLRYELSLIALLAMVIGSSWETYNTWKDGKIVGLAVSYTLLPLTVLAYYIKQWSIMMEYRKVTSL